MSHTFRSKTHLSIEGIFEHSLLFLKAHLSSTLEARSPDQFAGSVVKQCDCTVRARLEGIIFVRATFKSKVLLTGWSALLQKTLPPFCIVFVKYVCLMEVWKWLITYP